MNYCHSMPSLRRTACIKVAIALWDNIETHLELHNNFDFFEIQSLDMWERLEDRVIRRVQDLPLPDLLRQEVSNIIKPIGLQIYNWMYLNIRHFMSIRFRTKIFWTSQGTIDKIKTAKALVEDVRLSGPERYRLACTYCLKDYIFILWERLKLAQNDSFCCEVINDHGLLSFWTGQKIGLGELRNIWPSCTSVYRRLSFFSATYRKEAGFKFAFQELPHEYRKDNVVRLTQEMVFLREASECNELSDDFFGPVLCFLCSSMSEEQQTEFFKIRPYGMLACLLHWPRQSFFIETAERVWSSLSPKDYNCLLREIVHGKTLAGCKDYDYQNLFSEFWKRSPNTHKKYVIQKCLSNCELLFDLFKSEDAVNLKLFFESADAIQRHELIFVHKNIYGYLVHNGKWTLVEFFIRSCISSRSVLLQFRKETELYRRSYFSSNELNMWDRLLADDAIEQFDKEQHPEGSLVTETKKPCT